MVKLMTYVLILHAFVGGVALITGLISIVSKKGGQLHKKIGRVYFWAMTGVFVTGILIAGYQFDRFLFLIAFLSYYCVFSGVRALKLKQLHRGQQPRWYDFAAGIINATANLAFIAFGIYFISLSGISSAGGCCP